LTEIGSDYEVEGIPSTGYQVGKESVGQNRKRKGLVSRAATVERLMMLSIIQDDLIDIDY